jgi:hypothetical protein
VSDHARYRVRRKPRKCPACGSTNVVRILYGLPTAELFEDAEAGRIAIGGCCITEDDPSWRCVSCNTDIYKVGSDPQGTDSRGA